MNRDYISSSDIEGMKVGGVGTNSKACRATDSVVWGAARRKSRVNFWHKARMSSVQI